MSGSLPRPYKYGTQWKKVTGSGLLDPRDLFDDQIYTIPIKESDNICNLPVSEGLNDYIADTQVEREHVSHHLQGPKWPS